MRYFRENFVVYNGLEMHKRNPKYIIDAQRRVYVSSGRRRYRRIKYGDEPGWLKFNEKFADIPCHDCGVVKGQYHTDGCDVEECPKCHHQLLSCAGSAQTGEWFLSA